ncbi:c-type cytochrome [Hufsiella ginkgonis]|uniref:c-type cytochrome n=1 Tax=Hufsiella ginkgonis TaxID=2695274 RepID=UPI001F2B798B|nr:c-type cytochrome [Hufsiella ginkgonis]
MARHSPPGYLFAGCHGHNLQGTGKTANLLAGKFRYGAGKRAIATNITNGIIDQGMPAWAGAITKADIDKLVNYIYTKTRKK